MYILLKRLFRLILTERKLDMNNKGMTMVEVLVGFVILSLIMGGVFHMIRFGSNMLYEAVDIKHSQESFEEETYKTTPDASIIKLKTIKELGAGDFVLKPANEPLGNKTQVNKELSINLFEASAEDATADDADALKNKLQTIGYKDSGNDYNIEVYGFEK